MIIPEEIISMSKKMLSVEGPSTYNGGKCQAREEVPEPHNDDWSGEKKEVLIKFVVG